MRALASCSPSYLFYNVSYYLPLSYCFCLHGEKGYMQEGCSVNGQIYVMGGRNSITVFSNQWGPPGLYQEDFQKAFWTSLWQRPEAATRHLINQELLLHRESTMHTGKTIFFFQRQCHNNFCFRFFFMNHLPPNP
jgi:hypothetical protein